VALANVGERRIVPLLLDWRSGIEVTMTLSAMGPELALMRAVRR
jgi:hypothetical protein